MDHDIGRRQGIPLLKPTEDFADPALQEMTHHRIPNLTAGSNSETGLLLIIGMVMKRGQRTVLPQSLSIATQKIRPTAHPLITGETLSPHRILRLHWASLSRHDEGEKYRNRNRTPISRRGIAD